MSAPSPSPVRFPSGVSTDFPYGPLANFGLPNPVDYAVTVDDFLYLNPSLVATKTGVGTLAVTPGDGGRLLFTTAATAPDLVSLQGAAANMTFTAGKKAFCLMRLQLSDVVNSALVAGVIQTTATPGTVTDGLYFSKASGSATNLSLISMVGSVPTTLVIPTAAYTLANNIDIDLGWYVDRNQTVYAFVGSQLVGWLPQSGSGATTPVRGACASFAPTLTGAVLSGTLAIIAGTASAKTMNADFFVKAKER